MANSFMMKISSLQTYSLCLYPAGSTLQQVNAQILYLTDSNKDCSMDIEQQVLSSNMTRS